MANRTTRAGLARTIVAAALSIPGLKKALHDIKDTLALKSEMTANTTLITANTALIGSGSSEAITATVGGGTTGLISATTDLAVVTSSVATKQVSLPAAVGGKKLQIFCAANGVELISAVAGDKVNNKVVGATNEAALVAGTLYSLEYTGTDNWVMQGLTALGAVETPVVPDAL